MDCSPLVSSIRGISQARILGWVAISFSRRSFWPWDRTRISCFVRGFFIAKPPWRRLTMKSLSRVWFFATPWSVAHQAPPFMEFFQASVLYWVAISFSKGSSRPRDQTQVSHIVGRFFPSEPPGKQTMSLIPFNFNITFLKNFPFPNTHFRFKGEKQTNPKCHKWNLDYVRHVLNNLIKQILFNYLTERCLLKDESHYFTFKVLCSHTLYMGYCLELRL